MMTYTWFAECWQWTPRQVDELTLEEIFWLPVIKEARGDATDALSKD